MDSYRGVQYGLVTPYGMGRWKPSKTSSQQIGHLASQSPAPQDPGEGEEGRTDPGMAARLNQECRSSGKFLVMRQV